MAFRKNLLLLTALLSVQHLQAQRLIYVSPVPSSQMVSRATNIILRCDVGIDPQSLGGQLLDVQGSVSGSHPGSLILSDDGQTMLFSPVSPFSSAEQVSVSLRDGAKTLTGAAVDRIAFTFTTTPLLESLSAKYGVSDEGEVVDLASRPQPLMRPFAPVAARTDTIPPDFPPIRIDSINNPSPGYFFLATADSVAGDGYFAFMVDNSGNVVKYLRMHHHTYDFKQQPNGRYSVADGQTDWVYAGGSRSVHRVYDSTMAQVDSFRAGNGYDADSHEFRLLPNGHALLHAYDIQYFDLSKTIPGGNPNAIVVGSILQELDLQKNVVFQWRSWDYIPISDTYMSTTASAFDYIHINAYDLDDDGNIIASFRNTCEIVKINRMTGEVMWRMGGKHNQFTFIGENEANKPTYFTYQHHIRKLPNGNFTLFDNGNLHAQKFSRGVEYQVDQVNRTATLVWEYRHTPDIFAPARGSVQRMANGNTVIGWGSASSAGVGDKALTEIRPDKSIAFEMGFTDATSSYRALKFLVTAPLTPTGSVTLYDVLPGNTYEFKRGDSVLTGVSMTIKQSNAGYNNLSVKRYAAAPVNQAFTDLPPFVQPLRWVIKTVGLSAFTIDITFDSTALAPYADASRAVVYTRNAEGTGTFTPLTSVYDSAARSLTVTVTKLGEFIIGVPEQVSLPLNPTLIEPLQNARVNQNLPILIRWSSLGHITGSHIQIASDSLFTTLVYQDSALKSSAYLWGAAAPGSRYFWRAKARNEQGTSSWSPTGIFSTDVPYVEVVSPAAGAKLLFGVQTTLSWQSNVGSLVNIRLYRNGIPAAKIIDSTVNTGRYVWKPDAKTVIPDSTYSVRVIMSHDTALFGESKKFSVAAPTSVDPAAAVVDRYLLEQNYPNPFNPTTVVRAQWPVASDVKMVVYDLLGREVATLANGRYAAGRYEFTFDARDLTSGVYFCRLETRSPEGGAKGSFVAITKLLLLR